MEPESARYPELRFLNDFTDINKTRNRLPHWHQNRSTFFVTFRLSDSIPVKLLEEWRDDRNRWLIEHPQLWSPETEGEYHKRFSSAIDRHLDAGHGSCLLRNSENASMVGSAFRFFNEQRYLLHSWVIMPNHVHLLLSLGEGIALKDVISTWKRFTARSIHHRIGGSGNLWQKDYFDRIIRDWDHFTNVARYIRRIPVKASLREGEYLLEESPWIERLLS